MLPPSQLPSDSPKPNPNPNPNPTEMAAPSIFQDDSRGRTTEELSAPPRVVPSFPCPSPVPWTITDEFLASSAAREATRQDGVPTIFQGDSQGRTTTFPCPSPVPWTITDEFLASSDAREAKRQDGVKMPWKRTDFPDRMPKPGPAMPNLNLNLSCQICGAADHHTAACSYLWEIPRGAKIINETQFKIVCQCGQLLIDGACWQGCPPHIPLKVISTPFPWLTYTPIKNEPCRVWFNDKGMPVPIPKGDKGEQCRVRFTESSAARGESNRQDRHPKGMPETTSPFAFPDRMPEARPAMPNLNFNVTCQICGAADHHTAACSYLWEIPRGAKIINETQFKIVCQCGQLLIDGACCQGCPPHIPLKVISTPFSWLTYTPIKNEHCRVRINDKGMPETTSAFPDRIPKGGPAMPNFNLNLTCQICGAADHHTAACSYLVEIPRGAKIIDETHFKIVCQCGKLLVDGACSEGCPPHIPFKVISTPFS